MKTDTDVKSGQYERQQRAFKPLLPAARIGLIVLGRLALGLGVVGLIHPVLPTTPFFLIAMGC